MKADADKRKHRRLRLFEALVLLGKAAVVAKAIYFALHWREAWSAIAGMTGTEWLLAAAIAPPLLWLYCKI